MNVLRCFETDQDHGPQHGVRSGETDHQPWGGFWIAGARREPRC
jgi:hypothetical protein